jgi:membrane protease YdiL (CAAX protease family)
MSITRYLGVFLAWNIVVGISLIALDAPWGAVGAVIGTFLVLRGYLIRSDTRKGRRRIALQRFRPLTGDSLRWTLIAIPVLLLFAWFLADFYVRLVPVPPESMDPFGPMMDELGGQIAVALLAVAIAPLIEELFFRGLIQRSLERRLGGGKGIVAASALFAAVHVLPWIFPLHFILGLIFGFAVYATGSIWAGVILHLANNAVAVVAMALGWGEGDAPLTVWATGPTPELLISAVMLALSIGLSWWVGRKLWSSGPLAPDGRVIAAEGSITDSSAAR